MVAFAPLFCILATKFHFRALVLGDLAAGSAICVKQHAMVDVVDYEAGEGHAEDGGYVNGGAVYLSFGGTPVVIQESRIAGDALRDNTGLILTGARANAFKTIFSRARTAIMTTVRMKTSLI